MTCRGGVGLVLLGALACQQPAQFMVSVGTAAPVEPGDELLVRDARDLAATIDLASAPAPLTIGVLPAREGPVTELSLVWMRRGAELVRVRRTFTSFPLDGTPRVAAICLDPACASGGCRGARAIDAELAASTLPDSLEGCRPPAPLPDAGAPQPDAAPPDAPALDADPADAGVEAGPPDAAPLPDAEPIDGGALGSSYAVLRGAPVVHDVAYSPLTELTYVVGDSNGAFEVGSETIDRPAGTDGHFSFLLAFEPGGTLRWYEVLHRGQGGDPRLELTAVAVDPDGSLYIGGHFENGPLELVGASIGDGSAFVARMQETDMDWTVQSFAAAGGVELRDLAAAFGEVHALLETGSPLDAADPCAAVTGPQLLLRLDSDLACLAAIQAGNPGLVALAQDELPAPVAAATLPASEAPPGTQSIQRVAADDVLLAGLQADLFDAQELLGSPFSDRVYDLAVLLAGTDLLDSEVAVAARFPSATLTANGTPIPLAGAALGAQRRAGLWVPLAVVATMIDPVAVAPCDGAACVLALAKDDVLSPTVTVVDHDVVLFRFDDRGRVASHYHFVSPGRDRAFTVRAAGERLAVATTFEDAVQVLDPANGTSRQIGVGPGVHTLIYWLAWR